MNYNGVIVRAHNLLECNIDKWINLGSKKRNSVSVCIWSIAAVFHSNCWLLWFSWITPRWQYPLSYKLHGHCTVWLICNWQCVNITISIRDCCLQVVASFEVRITLLGWYLKKHIVWPWICLKTVLFVFFLHFTVDHAELQDRPCHQSNAVCKVKLFSFCQSEMNNEADGNLSHVTVWTMNNICVVWCLCL